MSVAAETERRCEIKDVESVELPKFLRNNSTNVLLSWRTEDCHSDQVVKISVLHLEYLACQEYKKDFNIKELLAEGSSVIIEDLHHYSEYRFDLEIGDVKEQLRMRTSASVPRVRVGLGVIDYDYRDTDTSLSISWRPPPPSDCPLYQSQLGHYHYQVIGLEDWNSQSHKSGTVPFGQTKLSLNNLLPFSHYNFFVYVTNSQGEYHHDFFRKFEKRTKVGRPNPPVNLSMTESGDGMRLFWRTPFPPTGQLGSFEIAQSSLENSDIEMKIVRVEDTVSIRGTFSINMNSLKPSRKYSIKIRSFNKNYQEASDWSDEIEYEIQENGSRSVF